MSKHKERIAKSYSDAASVWDDTGVLWEMEYTVTKLIEKLEPLSNPTILDVGCGTGYALFELYKKLDGSGDYHGIDISENMIKEARKNANQRKYNNCTFNVSDAEKMDYPDQTFDLVISNMVLQYLPDQEKGLKEILRVLKQGGKIAIATEGEHYGRFYFSLLRDVAKELGFSETADLWDWFDSNHKPVDVLFDLFIDIGYKDVVIHSINYANYQADLALNLDEGMDIGIGFYKDTLTDEQIKEYKKALLEEGILRGMQNIWYNEFHFIYGKKNNF